MASTIWKSPHFKKALAAVTAFSLALSSVFIQKTLKVYAAHTINSGNVVINQALIDQVGTTEFIIENGVQSVRIEGDITVDIALNNVTINQAGGNRIQSPISVRDGAFATFHLVGNSTLTGGYSSRNVGFAGLHVAEDAVIVIEGPGSLTATGGQSPNNYGGAGIGGGAMDQNVTQAQILDATASTTAGDIRINGGTVIAKGGNQAAGIGGGTNGAATSGEIYITGGTITATGGNWAAGIGDGDSVKADSTGRVTSPDFYTAPYRIEVTDGTIKAIGGVQAGGIGATDMVATEGNFAVSSNSQLNIVLSGGTIEARSGDPLDTEGGAAAIGAGVGTRMENNSITVGKDAIIHAVSYGNYAISENYLMPPEGSGEPPPLPTINVDPDSYLYLCRFPNYISTEERTFQLYKLLEDGTRVLVNTYVVPDGYRAIAVTLHEPGKYELIGPNGSMPFEFDIDENSGTNSGEVVYDEYQPDAKSAPFTDIQFSYRAGTEDAPTVENIIYTYNPVAYSYDLYVPQGTTSVDIKAFWEACNAQVTIANDTQHTDPSVTERTRTGVLLEEDGETTVFLSKRDDADAEFIYNTVSYKFVIHEQQHYIAELNDMNKTYDGKPVVPRVDLLASPDETTLVYNYTSGQEPTVRIEQSPQNFDPVISWENGAQFVYVTGKNGKTATVYITASTAIAYEGTELVATMKIYQSSNPADLTAGNLGNLSPACTIEGRYDTSLGDKSTLVLKNVNGQSVNECIIAGNDVMYSMKAVKSDVGEVQQVQLSYYELDGKKPASTATLVSLIGRTELNPGTEGEPEILDSNLKWAVDQAQNGSFTDPPVEFYHKTRTVRERTFSFTVRTTGTGADSVRTITLHPKIIREYDQTGTVHKESSQSWSGKPDMSGAKYTFYKIGTDGSKTPVDGAPKDIGHYRAEVYLESAAYTAEGSREFEIKPRLLTVTGVEFYRKPYDGLAEMPIEKLGEIYFNNLVSGETVRILPDSASFQDSAVKAAGDYLVLYDLKFDTGVGNDYLNYEIQDRETKPVYGEIYYPNDSALFVKGENGADPWRKYYPTTNTTPEYSNEMEITLRARTVGRGEELGVYAFDIAFGEMKFVFARSTWNPVIHQYESKSDIAVESEEGGWFGFDGEQNKITVTNRSNRDVRFDLTVDVDWIVGIGGLNGYFSAYSTPDTAVGNEITTVTVPATKEHATAEEVSKQSVYFYFNNKPPQMGESDLYIPAATLTLQFYSTDP